MQQVSSKPQPAKPRIAAPEKEEDFTGEISGCTVEDRPALLELCEANDPLSSAIDIAGVLKDKNLGQFGQWAAYRDNNHTIRVAVLMHPKGALHLMMRPEDMGEPEVKQGFLRLMVGVHKLFKAEGVTDATILCSNQLKPFMDMLRAQGFLGREVYVVHAMRSTAAGEIERAQ